MGRPISLLNERSLRSVTYRCESTSATNSFVVVLPTLPVMPITRGEWRRRQKAASRCNAFNVSGTSNSSGIVQASGSDGSGPVRSTVGASTATLRWTTVITAPRSSPSATKS